MSSAVNQFFGYLSECADWLFGLVYEMNMTLFNHNNYMMNVIFIYCFYVLIILPVSAEVFLSIFFSFKTKRLVIFSPKFVGTLKNGNYNIIHKSNNASPKQTKSLVNAGIVVKNSGGFYENFKSASLSSRVSASISSPIKANNLSSKVSAPLTSNNINASTKSANLTSKVTASNISSKVSASNISSKVSASNISNKISSSNISNKVSASNFNTKVSSGISSKNLSNKVSSGVNDVKYRRGRLRDPYTIKDWKNRWNGSIIAKWLKNRHKDINETKETIADIDPLKKSVDDYNYRHKVFLSLHEPSYDINKFTRDMIIRNHIYKKNHPDDSDN